VDEGKNGKEKDLKQNEEQEQETTKKGTQRKRAKKDNGFEIQNKNGLLITKVEDIISRALGKHRPKKSKVLGGGFCVDNFDNQYFNNGDDSSNLDGFGDNDDGDGNNDVFDSQSFDELMDGTRKILDQVNNYQLTTINCQSCDSEEE